MPTTGSGAAPDGVEDIDVPANDNRLYRYVELSNGLTALLISDANIGGDALDEAPQAAGGCWPSFCGRRGGEEEAEENAKTAACALAVGVGYLTDPPKIGGLAHFLEHMLFMGTAKYPKENGWNAYLSAHGGSDNGETEAETTVFYFDVKHDFLRPALERFGSFFSCPLLKWEGSTREVRAIDSEFNLAQQNDQCRADQLIAHLSDDGHVYRRFGWGNAKSLVELPKADGTDMRAALATFHKQWYSANLMTLVILGREPLDTLQAWAVASFGATPNHKVERPLQQPSAPPLSPSRLPMWLTAPPLEQARWLSLNWYIPAQTSRGHVQCKPCDLLGSLIGHEGRGSILSLLKRRGLCTALSAGVFPGDTTSAASLFRVQVELTKVGCGAMEEVIAAVLTYIGMLAAGGAPPMWCWEEVRDIASLQFRYADEVDGVTYVRQIAMDMQHRHPPKQTLSAEQLYEAYIPELVQACLEQLTPGKMLVVEQIRDDEEDASGSGAGDGAGDGVGDGTGAGDGDGNFALDKCGDAAEEMPVVVRGVSSGGERGPAASTWSLPMLKPGSRRVQRVSGCFCTVEKRCEQHIKGPARAMIGAPGAAAMDSVFEPSAMAATDLNETEPWFGVQFKRESVQGTRLSTWQAAYDRGFAIGLAPSPSSPAPPATTASTASGGDASGLDGARDDAADLTAHFHLPAPNEYIPTDFALRTPAADDGSDAPGKGKRAAPQLLLASAGGCCFFLPDTRWHTPKSMCWLDVTLGRRTRLATAGELLLNELCVELTLEALNEESYAATTAGLAYTLVSTWRGYVISAGGFSHKCPELALRVAAALMSTVRGPVDAALFERSVARMALKLRNSGRTVAERGRNARLECLEVPHYSSAAQLAALTSLTPAMLDAHLSREFAPTDDPPPAGPSGEVVPPVHVTAFAYGNLDAPEARRFYDAALRTLQPDATHDAEPLTVVGAPASAETAEGGVMQVDAAAWRALPPHVAGGVGCVGCVLLPTRPPRHCRLVAATNASESNRAVELYWQLGPVSYALCARMELLVHLMWEPIFNRLRTKEQLGYAVDCSTRNTHGVLGFAISVTTASATPKHVETRAMRFLRTWVPTIGKMRPSEYAANVAACVSYLLRDDRNAAEESDRNLAEIESRQYVWDRAEREASAMRAISQAELAAWAKDVLLREDARGLSIHAHEGSVDKPAEQPMPDGATAIDEPDGWKAPLAVVRQRDRALPSVDSAV